MGSTGEEAIISNWHEFPAAASGPGSAGRPRKRPWVPKKPAEAFAKERCLSYAVKVGPSAAIALSWGFCVGAEPASEASAQSNALEVVVSAPPKGALERASGDQEFSPQRALEQAAVTLGEFFQEQAALGVSSGNAGLGGAPNKINLAARAINPRFSSRTQFIWDDMPLAIAPYGRPQMTLFPVSIAWMNRIRVSLHGAQAQMGPHSIGGHLRMSLLDIPRGERESLSLSVDHFGRVQANALMQLARSRQQWALGYTTMQGDGYRQHSKVNSHGAMLRWRRRVGLAHRLGLLGFLYGEESQIPGGIRPEQFKKDPRMSQRPLDRFVGLRAGGGLFWSAILARGVNLKTRLVGGATDRRSEVSTETLQKALVAPLRVSPRRFSFVQLASRLAARMEPWGARGQIEPLARLGMSSTLEWAQLRSENRDPQRPSRLELRSRDEESIRAIALHASLGLRDRSGRWFWKAGLRSEWLSLMRQDIRAQRFGRYYSSALLPSTELRYAPLSELSLFASYGQTFSPPQFLQIALAQEQQEFRPERGHSAELGLRLALWRGRLRGSSVGFFKEIRHYADVSAERLDRPGRLRAIGAEQQLELQLPLPWGSARLGPHFRAEAGYSWTHARIVEGEFDGLRVPWVPRHRLRSSVGLNLRGWGAAFVRLGLRHEGTMSSDYRPELQEDPTGARGQIPAWTTLWASLGASSLRLAPGWTLRVALGVDNLLNQLQYSRTPDRNAGRIMLSPRRFRLSLGLEHRRSLR